MSVLGILHPDFRFIRYSLLCLLLLSGCFPATRRTTERAGSGSSSAAVAEGEASYYADVFEGRTTASGEIFRQSELTGAHRDYPFGTIVRVVNVRNGLEVTVRINDRGPFKRSRIIDLSRGAAERIDLIKAGVGPVRLEVLSWGQGS